MKLPSNILILLLLSFRVLAQEADSVEVKADSVVKKDYRPTGIRIGTDVLSIVKSGYDKTFEGWEVNADVDFNRYYFVVDYGYWARNLADTAGGHYTNDGRYWRIGADVNFLTKDPDKNMFFIGARYGRSKFSENLSYAVDDPIWGPVTNNLINTNVPASWFELTTGLRVKIWKFLWMGYTARLKFALNVGDTPEMTSSDVPGYGRADKPNYWGFNYQIFVRFPVRKDTLIPLKK